MAVKINAASGASPLRVIDQIIDHKRSEFMLVYRKL
jgi:hypothetical protein